MRYKTLLFFILTVSAYSQNISRDSIFELKLALFINEYHFLDSAYQSALKEIDLCDSSLVKQLEVIEGYKHITFNLEQTNRELQFEIARLKSGKLNWLIPFGGGVLTIVAIWITTLIISK